jgi:hypothetical protein
MTTAPASFDGGLLLVQTTTPTTLTGTSSASPARTRHLLGSYQKFTMRLKSSARSLSSCKRWLVLMVQRRRRELEYRRPQCRHVTAAVSDSTEARVTAAEELRVIIRSRRNRPSFKDRECPPIRSRGQPSGIAVGTAVAPCFVALSSSRVPVATAGNRERRWGLPRPLLN